MHTRQRSSFMTITSEGALLPLDILQKIALFDSEINGLDGESYYLVGVKLNEAISASWGRLLTVWQGFQGLRRKLAEDESGLTQTRERWLLPLFQELGYGRLYTVKPLEIEEKSYPISHGWQHLPIHLVSFRSGLDQPTRNATSGYRFSPYSLVQEFLNRSSDHLWGLASNGLRLRLLRKNASLTRQAYVEFDLEAMFTNEAYAEFVLFWLLCHQSRVQSEHPAECWLERWSRLAQDQGVRVLKQLRKGVEEAINLLGSGFLAHKDNGALKEKLRAGDLKAQDYYAQVLRFVYRLLILFVAEDREILFHPDADPLAQQRYAQYYSTGRLRRMAGLRLGTRHSDLFRALWLVMEQLGGETGCQPLGLPALNGFLFTSARSMPDLIGCELENASLLAAVRALAFTEEKAIRRTVDYKNLGAEELGSIYESLLELHPQIDLKSNSFTLVEVSGNARKTSGSYYTPTSLIDCLLDSALDPVLVEASARPDPEAALLALKVCDPACGSGHFLIAAAHRIAKRLAGVRTGTEEPGLRERRAALRDVIGHCIYGVDINPMAVELCKVSLWMEAIEPGKPLSFLDAHIQYGNSLLGTTPALLKNGIPNEAFEAIEGDDKKVCTEFKKKNNEQRIMVKKFTESVFQPWMRLGDLDTGMRQLDAIPDDNVAGVRQKEAVYTNLRASDSYLYGKLWADAWCAAFVWKKTKDFAYPITEEIFRNIEFNPYKLTLWMREEIQRLAEQYQFFHWHLAFPEVFSVPADVKEAENEQTGWSGGFDVVLGNPPWGKVKTQEKEWFSSFAPQIAKMENASQREALIKSLSFEEPIIYAAYLEEIRRVEGESHFLRNSGMYPLCGRGDVNYYAVFSELMRSMIGLKGKSGCIVQSGIATDDTTKFFFQDVITKKSLVSFYDFKNRKYIFPEVESTMKFCLLTLSKEPCTQALIAAQLDEAASLKDPDKTYSLSFDEIKKINPNTLNCPVFSSTKDARIIRSIYDCIPIFLKEGSPERNIWEISFNRMFDMTNHSSLFRNFENLIKEKFVIDGKNFSKGKDIFLPLYESKLTDQFNHRAATFDGIPSSERFRTRARTNETTLSDLCNPDFDILPRYWIAEQEIISRIGQAFWSLGFRNAMSAVADSRSLVAAIIPSAGVGNSMPLVLCGNEGHKACILLAGMNSFILDYILRQKNSGGNLNFYVFKQLPFPDPEKFSAHVTWLNDILGNWIVSRALELSYTAWDLEAFANDCGYAGPPFRWDEERRFLLRGELDAAYFHLYGITRDDVDYIMDTFPVVKRREEKQFGEYRTKRVILEIYDEMSQAMATGTAYVTRLVPGPADPAVAHEPRQMDRLVAD